MLIKSRILSVALAIFIVLNPMTAAKIQAEEKSFPIMDVEKLVNMVNEDGKGKVMIVSVFASWCPPCREEMPMLVKIRAETPEKDLCLVGLSLDEDTGALGSFVEQHQTNFPVYLGTAELISAMGITLIPHTFIFDRKGELVESFDGLIPEQMFRSVLTKLLSESSV